MRAVVRRHRLRPGDRLVVGPPNAEIVLPPLIAVGEHTVVLLGGDILEFPPDRAAYIERTMDEDALLAVAQANARNIRAD